eukprot:362073-Chlamydomonas_euryale.AAC.3
MLTWTCAYAGTCACMQIPCDSAECCKSMRRVLQIDAPSVANRCAECCKPMRRVLQIDAPSVAN